MATALADTTFVVDVSLGRLIGVDPTTTYRVSI